MITYDSIASFINNKIYNAGVIEHINYYLTNELLTLFLRKYYDDQELEKDNVDYMIIKLNNKNTAVKLVINGKVLTFYGTPEALVAVDEKEQQVLSIKTNKTEQGKTDVLSEVIIDDAKFEYKVKNYEAANADSYEFKRSDNDITTQHGEFFTYGVRYKSNTELFDFRIYDNKTGKKIKDDTSFFVKLLNSLNGCVYPDGLVSIRTGYDTEQIDNIETIFNTLETDLSVYYKSKSKNKARELK